MLPSNKKALLMRIKSYSMSVVCRTITHAASNLYMKNIYLNIFLFYITSDTRRYQKLNYQLNISLDCHKAETKAEYSIDEVSILNETQSVAIICEANNDTRDKVSFISDIFLYFFLQP